MIVKSFPKETKPREIFVYVCECIAEPLTALGFKYRKSKNDIYKADGTFLYRIWFQPSIKFSSTTFSVHISVESKKFALWQNNNVNKNGNGVIITTTLARLTKRTQEWPWYDVSTPTERERSISEVLQQINDFAIPFFERFKNIDLLVDDVRSQGFLPHRKNQYGIDVKRKEMNFIHCFGIKNLHS